VIKHRFILRDISDFKVFAAIPVESSLLTWKKWVRPPDWAAMEALHARLVKYVELRIEIDVERARIGRESAAAQTAVNALYGFYYDVALTIGHAAKADKSAEELRRWVQAVRAYPVLPKDSPTWLKQMKEFVARADTFLCKEGRRTTPMPQAPQNAVKHLYEQRKRQGFKLTPELLKCAQLTDAEDETINRLIPANEEMAAIQSAAQELLSSNPLPDTPCPPGLPFAAYTVEFASTVVNVVEGCAWVALRPAPTQATVTSVEKIGGIDGSGRVIQGVVDGFVEDVFVATDEEKRVVEIISQMLTERGINPKADTRIPVREVDPKHAHQTREAEHRASTISVRTIKFEITPPRYLREAVEQLERESVEVGYVPRKAHWVIGHWRNQPYGVRHTQRKQIWIAPHIRGLGEASAVVARVAAPRPEAKAPE
jgi:hypothetical protein